MQIYIFIIKKTKQKKKRKKKQEATFTSMMFEHVGIKNDRKLLVYEHYQVKQSKNYD